MKLGEVWLAVASSLCCLSVRVVPGIALSLCDFTLATFRHYLETSEPLESRIMLSGVMLHFPPTLSRLHQREGNEESKGRKENYLASLAIGQMFFVESFWRGSFFLNHLGMKKHVVIICDTTSLFFFVGVGAVYHSLYLQ